MAPTACAPAPTPASAPTPAPAPAHALTSPLAATYRRLTELCPALDVTITEPGAAAGPPDRQSRLDGAELAHRPDALDAFVAAEARRIEARHDHTPRPDVAASRALHSYLWDICLLMSGAWYLERRVPRIRPAEVRVDLVSGALTVAPGASFACLPGDAAAALPGARVVAHEEALRAELRTAVADHVGPLLSAIGPRLRRGQRALWGMVGDDLVSGIWQLGRATGEEERALVAADAVLPGPLGPFPGGADFRCLTDADGGRHPTRTRLGCCLYYTIRPAEACGTCPRTDDAERLRRLTQP
ncbi:(2Fe-2S)-binding protein [Streptomyces sp. NPDC059009]|uniref:(2Fe-2S)-binding protein n=1 Tax=Streptomyces sp. NPDC059009 TaxID=3346694 RepID=UPI0036933C15